MLMMNNKMHDIAEESQDKEQWTFEDFKRGHRAEPQEAPVKVVGRPQSRTVSMTRRPMTATFDKSKPTRMSAVFEAPTAKMGVPSGPHRTGQPSSDATVGSAAAAHVGSGSHKTRQPSSDPTVGAPASAHVGAAARRSPRQPRRPPPLHMEHFTPLELELMQQLTRTKNALVRLDEENRQLRMYASMKRAAVPRMRRSPTKDENW